MRVVAWIADGDFFCETCLPYPKDGTDRAGNEVLPLYADDEIDYPVHCAKCDAFLKNRLSKDGRNFVIEQALADIDGYGKPSSTTEEWLNHYQLWNELWDRLETA